MSFSQCFKWSAKVAASFSIAQLRALLVGMKVFSLSLQLCFTCEGGSRWVRGSKVQQVASLQGPT